MRIKTSLLLIILTGSAVFFWLNRSGNDAAGLIVEVNVPTAEAALLRRSGETLRVERFMAVFENDEINIENGSIVVRYFDESRIELSANDTPYQVPVYPDEFRLGSNVMDLVLEDLSRDRNQAEVQLSTRDPFAAPTWTVASLTSGDAVAAAHRNRILLSWQGGAPDFTLTLTASDGRVLDVARTNAEEAWIGSPELPTGAPISVELADAFGQTISGRFLLTSSPSRSPIGPAAPDGSEAEIAAHALWLAENGERGWSFEALQLAAELRDTDEAASPIEILVHHYSNRRE